MKILFFSHQSDFIYGGEIVTLEFMRALKAAGVNVHFAAPQGEYFERASELGVSCHKVSAVQFSRSFSQLRGTCAALGRVAGELRAILDKEKIDVLHATSLKAMVYAWRLGKRLPIFWHHHDILPPGLLNSLWLRGISLRAFRILAPSRATRAALIQAGVPDKKVFVLWNGFRLEDWHARPDPKPGHLFRVGLVGEISSRKGTDRLGEILKEMGSIEGYQFLLVGEGLSEPEFAASLKEKLQSRSVRFLGRLKKMKLMYHEFDVLLVPSRQDPLPTVIVEAGLSAVPIVAARTGGIPEMVEPGKNGFLFDTEKEAASQIKEVRANWKQFSLASREIAVSRYDISKLSRELIRHYEEALRG